MNLFDLLILAVVQGIAEFLPISSSGHLVLFGKWLGIEKAQGSLNIMLHAGTLGSIVVFYFSRILRLLEKDRRVIPLLIVGTIPAVVIGLYLKKYHESILVNPWIAASMLLVTGGILIASLLFAQARRHRIFRRRLLNSTAHRYLPSLRNLARDFPERFHDFCRSTFRFETRIRWNIFVSACHTCDCRARLVLELKRHDRLGGRR